MTHSFLHRNALELAEEVLSDTPVLTISGARQVGKSTLSINYSKVGNIDSLTLMRALRWYLRKQIQTALSDSSPKGH